MKRFLIFVLARVFLVVQVPLLIVKRILQVQKSFAYRYHILNIESVIPLTQCDCIFVFYFKKLPFFLKTTVFANILPVMWSLKKRCKIVLIEKLSKNITWWQYFILIFDYLRKVESEIKWSRKFYFLLISHEKSALILSFHRPGIHPQI